MLGQGPTYIIDTPGAMMKKIVIIGAGLAGSLLAIYMAKRGYTVKVYESRDDIRLAGGDKGKSINLALSCRGITSLQKLNLMDKVKHIIVPMRARAIHEENGEVKYQRFGRSRDEYINAIQRTDLNILLLNQALRHKNIEITFNANVSQIDLQKKMITYQTKADVHYESYDILLGADGAHSIVRDTLVKDQHIKATRTFLPHGYKELCISKDHGKDLAREHLHLWPRGAHLLLGNPNTDDSITGSLFLANEGPNSFAELTDEIKINTFFKSAYADAYPVMPNLVEEFLTHPTGKLSTVKCDNWFYKDSCLILGDAAHGLVPFFGQGMNSAFEDCRILNELLDSNHDDWRQVLPAFFAARKPNTDAVAAMSMENYQEIQNDIRNPDFNFRKRLEMKLMEHYSEHYVSKHVLVMFTNTPYEKAYQIGQLQATLLDDISKNIKTLDDIDWSDIDKMVKTYDKKLTNL